MITVLFADLVGFTSLAEHLDPEQVKRLVDGCFAQLVEDIAAFGGTVDKLLGDAIVALFGVPVAHEDDAERAVRAALRMHETLAQFAARPRVRALENKLQLRIGINTGVALVGTVAGTDHTAMGDVVNTASRLQSLAPPGGVLVGQTTHELSASTITYEERGDLEARGRDATVRAWLAVGASSLPGSRRRGRTAMFGRSTELALAMATFEFSLINSQAALIAIEGEGGVGKSRLVDELMLALKKRESIVLLEGSAVPYGENNIWWPFASAFFNRFGLDHQTPIETVLDVARQQTLHLGADPDPAAVEAVGNTWLHLLGYPSTFDDVDPGAARDELTKLIITEFDHRLREQPLVLSIRDVHWADPAVMALCEQLLVSLARRPFVLVTTSRPDPDLGWPRHTGNAAVVRVPLGPLGPKAAAELTRSVIGADVDDDTVRTIFERSGGNPLFLEELASLVADGGVVTDLPESLRAVVAARLDQLPPDQRLLLDNAAVLGPSGQIDALHRMSEWLELPFSSTTLRGLADSGLLGVDDKRWRFKSHSVRDVAYQTLTKKVRAARHAATAQALQGKQFNPDDVAHHLATAAELVNEIGPLNGVPPSIRRDAIEALDAAAQRAIEHGTLRQVVRLTTRAIELCDASFDTANPGRKSRLGLRRVSALIDMRQGERARSEADAILADALVRNDRGAEAGARRQLGVIFQTRGELPAARSELGRAVELYRMLGNDSDLADALRARGFLELFGGSMDDARWHLGEAEAIYTRNNDRRGLGWIEQHRAWMAFLAGNLKDAEEHLHRAADTLHDLGDRAGVGWAFGLLAYVQFYERRFTEAEQLATLVLREAKERGDDWAEAMMTALSAALKLWTGHLQEAFDLADHAREKFRNLRDSYGSAQALAILGRTQVALGMGNALRTLESLAGIQAQMSTSAYHAQAAAGIAMHAGLGDRAVSLATDAVEQNLAAGKDADESRVIRAASLLQIGDADRAQSELDQLSAEYVDHPFALSVGALTATMLGKPAAALSIAEQAMESQGRTYLDAVFAAVGAAGAATALGDSDSARRWLDDAASLAVGVGDVIAQALVLDAARRLLGETPDVASGALGAGELPDGWAVMLTAIGENSQPPSTSL